MDTARHVPERTRHGTTDSTTMNIALIIKYHLHNTKISSYTFHSVDLVESCYTFYILETFEYAVLYLFSTNLLCKIDVWDWKPNMKILS